MNIYNAIMKAADYIERNPRDFNFMAYRPRGCGTPGCALGWISFHANRPTHEGHHGALAEMGLSSGPGGAFDFYDRMYQLVGFEWKRSAEVCAHGLRLYAQKYHGHEKPTPAAPDWNAMASKWTVGDDVKSQELVS